MINNKTQDIMSYFDELLPDAKCELNYNKDYELVIAVMLSAQTTDKSVNKVTEKLFEKYPSLDALNNASIEDIEYYLKTLGLYKNKAKNLKSLVKMLIEDFNYQVPCSRDELMKLPGVGRKTSNVIRCEIFHQAEFPVDTHVERVSKRLGLAKNDDSVLDVELKLRKKFPKERYILLHHQFIHFGRYHCKSINPQCSECKLKKYCSYFKNKVRQQHQDI